MQCTETEQLAEHSLSDSLHCIALAFLLFSVTACSLCSFDGGVGSVGRRAATERTAPAIVVLGRLEGPAKWESS